MSDAVVTDGRQSPKEVIWPDGVLVVPVRRQNLASSVAEGLGRLILQGRFAPGERLPPYAELASRFGVSVATLREAISSLAGAGALEVKVGSGTYVRAGGAEPEHAALSWGLPTEAQELAEFTEARCAIDVVLSRLAAERGSEEESARLRTLLADLENANSNPEAFIEADLAMHVLVAEMARNRPLLRSMRAMLALLRYSASANIKLAWSDLAQRQLALRLKRQWVEAIAQHRPEPAAAAIAALGDLVKAYLATQSKPIDGSES